jgi:hypothetical protein
MSHHANIELAAVCFGTFWITVLATRGLIRLESGTHAPSAATLELGRQQQPHAKPEWHDLQIEELQGAWLQDTPLPNGQAERKIIEVSQNDLTMRLVGQHGETRVLARGVLQVAKPAHA